MNKDGNQSNTNVGTSNGNMKYNFIGVVFTSNASLKMPVVKIFFSCIENGFKPVLFKKEHFFDDLQIKIEIFLFIYYLLKPCLLLQELLV